MRTELGAAHDVVASAADHGRGAVWLIEREGPALVSVSANSGATRRHHETLPDEPCALALTPDATAVLLGCEDGTVWAIDAERPGAAPQLVQDAATALVDITTTRPERGPGALVLADASGVTAVALGDRRVRMRAAVSGVTGLAGGCSAVWATVNDGDHGAIVRLHPGEPEPVFLVRDLPPASGLTAAADGTTLLATHPSVGEVSMIAVASANAQRLSAGVTDGELEAVHLWPDGSVVIVGRRSIARLESLADLAPRPPLHPPRRALFVGSWVDLDADPSVLGLAPQAVSYRVSEGPSAGAVLSPAADGVGPIPPPRLTAGGRPGRYRIEMVERLNGRLLATADFAVTSEWNDATTGPPRCIQSWSGDRSEALAGRRWCIAAVLVDTADGRYPADHDPDKRRDDVCRLLTDPSGATAGSPVPHLLHDRIHGPVSLPRGWSAYFSQRADGRWSPIATTAQSVVTAALEAGVMGPTDLAGVDELLVLPWSPDAEGCSPARFVWPHASAGRAFLLTGWYPDRHWRALACTFVAPDHELHAPGSLAAVLSHTSGHGRGLPDLAATSADRADVARRVLRGWDAMAGLGRRPTQHGVASRLHRRWIPLEQVRRHRLQGHADLAETVTLHAAEMPAPPPGRVVAVDLLVAQSKRFVVEYHTSPVARVLVTQLAAQATDDAAGEPLALLADDGLDGTGAVLDVGERFDAADAAESWRLSVKAVSTARDAAVVTIDYTSTARADPVLESADRAIEVRNTKSVADPARWRNRPWPGRANTIVARVRNHGDLPARDLRCDFYVTDLAAGPTVPLTAIGSQCRDVPAGSTVEFAVQWIAPDRPATVVAELRPAPGQGSPSRRVLVPRAPQTRTASGRPGTTVRLANPFDQPTIVRAVVWAHPSSTRVFVDREWSLVAAGAHVPVTVEQESPAAAPGPAALGIEAWADQPPPRECLASARTGHVCLELESGRPTEVDIDQVDRASLRGRVRYQDDGRPVGDGMVLVTVQRADVPSEMVTSVAPLAPDGSFAAEVARPAGATDVVVEAHYLGGTGAASSESGAVSSP